MVDDGVRRKELASAIKRLRSQLKKIHRRLEYIGEFGHRAANPVPTSNALERAIWSHDTQVSMDKTCDAAMADWAESQKILREIVSLLQSVSPLPGQPADSQRLVRLLERLGPSYNYWLYTFCGKVKTGEIPQLLSHTYAPPETYEKSGFTNRIDEEHIDRLDAVFRQDTILKEYYPPYNSLLSALETIETRFVTGKKTSHPTFVQWKRQKPDEKRAESFKKIQEMILNANQLAFEVIKSGRFLCVDATPLYRSVHDNRPGTSGADAEQKLVDSFLKARSTLRDLQTLVGNVIRQIERTPPVQGDAHTIQEALQNVMNEQSNASNAAIEFYSSGKYMTDSSPDINQGLLKMAQEWDGVFAALNLAYFKKRGFWFSLFASKIKKLSGHSFSQADRL